MEVKFQNDKSVHVTLGEKVLNTENGTPMDQCNHEEADTHVLVHLFHALQSSSLGLVQTGDTDVVIILLSTLHHITAANPAAQIWISFKTSKSVKMISLNSIASGLGGTTCKAMAVFQLLRGQYCIFYFLSMFAHCLTMYKGCWVHVKLEIKEIKLKYISKLINWPVQSTLKYQQKHHNSNSSLRHISLLQLFSTVTFA